MAKDPFPGCGGEEAVGAAPPPEDRWDGAEEALDALVARVDAGLVEIPDDGGEDADPAAFAPGGLAEGMAPGPVLAGLVHAAVGRDGAGLGALTEDQLLGVIAAARRLESRTSWTQLAAIAEFAARRAAGPPGPAQFACDELAYELGLTWHGAAGQIDYARTVAARLPRTFAALAAGTIHPVQLRIIEDETRMLSDADAAKADEELAEAARSKTWAQLRSAAHRLVLRLDPEAAQRRREAARRDAHLRWFREQSGNGGMVARELPSEELLASQQHVEQRALELLAAGVPGSLRELRVRAWLDLLQERDSRIIPAGQQAGQAGGAAGPDGGPAGAEADGGPDGSGGNGGPGRTGSSPAGTGPVGQARDAGPDAGPSLAALVNITVPLGTLFGELAVPGQAAGFGPLDPDTARDLVAAAARDPRTRWCVTALGRDRTAAAHACVSGRHHPPRLGGAGPPGPPGVDGSGPPGPPPPGCAEPGPLGARAADFLAGLKVKLSPVIRGPCDHARAEAGYRPSRNLAHLVRARTARCSAPGCDRPAVRCDLDHTVAWDDGGRTCPCNLAPLCRHHHRCKQADGWSLTQPEPGVLVWRTPTGRTYATTPTVYAG